MENNTEEFVNEMSYSSTKKARMLIEEATEKGAIITLPLYYKVGENVLDVYVRGERLIPCTVYDDATTGHYSEVGENGSISNQIKLNNAWNLESGAYLEFETRGEWSNE